MNGRGNVGVGGNDPSVASNIQRTTNLTNPPAPPGAAPMGPPQAAAGPAPVQNEVAQYLAMAFDAFMRSGPTQENLSAIQGFLASLQEVGRATQTPPAPAAPVGAGGQAPLPPMPGPNAPLPPMQ